MKTPARALAILFLTVLPLFADPIPKEVAANASGPELASLIRNAIPEETAPISGTLIIRSKGQTTNVPVVCKMEIHPDSWVTEYDVIATNNVPAEKLVITHRTNAANEYLYARAASATAELPKLEPLTAEAAANTALGGSDFSAADLGLDFLHWPQQRRLPHEMRLGQPVYVLESRNSGAKNLGRVKSYIDEEANAPIEAEAYDAAARMVKKFSLHGSGIKKVDGHWRVQEMWMNSYKDGKKSSETELKFNLPTP